jgi:Mn-dependent DtxR family transcriptional regulator
VDYKKSIRYQKRRYNKQKTEPITLKHVCIKKFLIKCPGLPTKISHCKGLPGKVVEKKVRGSEIPKK